MFRTSSQKENLSELSGSMLEQRAQAAANSLNKKVRLGGALTGINDNQNALFVSPGAQSGNNDSNSKRTRIS